MVPSDELVRRAAGTTPEAALYQPVDFQESQRQAILQNLANFQDAAALTRQTNNSITNDALKRIAALVPGYQSAVQRYGLAASDLLNGRLPFNDVTQILGDRSAFTSTVGIPGTAGPASLRDLGLSQLQGLQTGGSILKDMVQMAQTISPVERYATPQQMFVSPIDRIRGDLEQAQLIQQSEQNRNNLAAMGDPRAQLQLGLQTAGINGYQGGSPVGAGIAAGVGSLGSSVLGMAGSGMLGGSGAGGAGGSAGTGGFASPQMAQAAAYPGYTGGASYLSGSGWVPRATYYNGNPGAALTNYTGRAV